MNKIDEKTLESLSRIAEYMQESEETSYQESDQDDAHIYNHVVVLQTFLDNYKHGNSVPLADVYNLTSPRGNKEVPNQFVITTDAGTYFKSYQSLIAFIPKDNMGQTVLDKFKWDFSTTTGKYRNQFLGESIEDTRKKIKDGTYILADLNKSNS